MLFVARLALALGKSIRWVENLDAGELLTWQMVDAVHPFGDKRADIRNGILADMMRAANGNDPIGAEKYIWGRVGPEEKPQEFTEDDVTDLFGFNFGENS